MEPKAKPLSGLQKGELTQRIGSLSSEEMVIIAGMLPDELLWEELKKRFDNQQRFISEVKNSMNTMEGK